MKTNATMLYGHIETFEHRVDHSSPARTAGQERRVFKLHPARLSPRGNGIVHLPGPTGVDDLRTIAR